MHFGVLKRRTYARSRWSAVWPRWCTAWWCTRAVYIPRYITQVHPPVYTRLHTTGYTSAPRATHENRA